MRGGTQTSEQTSEFLDLSQERDPAPGEGRKPRRARRGRAAHVPRGTPAALAAPFRPTAAGWTARLSVAAGLVVFVFTLPAVVPFEFQADLISLAAIYGCVALSMNVLVGYLGQLSLGHQAFYGIGAFAAAIVTTDPRFELPFVVGIAAAGLIGAVSALLIGYVALRVRGLYLAIVTLSYGLLAEQSLFAVGFLSQGIPADRPAGFESSRAFAYICLAVLAALFAVDWRLMKSKAGRAILAIRDDERVAGSFGISTTRFKLLAFVISGTYAGIAGGLFGHMLGFVSAENEFDLFLALTFVLMTVVGGLGNRVGVIIGAVIFATLDELLEVAHLALPDFIPAPNPIYVPVIGAGLLLLTLIRFPGGIGQQITPIQQWVRGGRFDLHAGKRTSSATGGGTGGRP